MRQSLKHTLESLGGCLISQIFNMFTRASFQRRILGIALCVCVCMCCVCVCVGGGRGRVIPVFCNHLLFCNHIEELQTVGLIINNAPLTYVYPNAIKMCLTPNHLIFGRHLLYFSNTE